MPPVVRVPRNDTAFASQRCGYLFGPLDNLDGPERLRARLLAIANGGPANRIGLSPSRTSRRWYFDPLCRNVLVTEIDDASVASAPTVLLDFIHARTDFPLHIGVSPQWLILAFDHGLGAGRLMVELAAGMTSDDPGFAEPTPRSECVNPGLTAAVHTLRRSPARLLSSATELLRPGTKLDGTATDLPINNGTALVHARSEPHFLAELRAERNSQFPDASVLGVLGSQVLRAFLDVGLTPAGETNFLIDMNRYLPPSTGTLGNFVGMATVPVSAPFDPRTITGHLDAYTSGCRSLTRYGRSYLSQVIRPRRPLTRIGTAEHAAALMISDHRMPQINQKMRWATGERVFLTTAPFQRDNQVTMVLAPIGDQLQISATFRATVHSPDKMQAALDRVVSPSRRPRLRQRESEHS